MMMSDLPEELVEEILSRVPISSLGPVRSTCKRWNDLSKDRTLCKAEIKQQFLGLMLKEYKVCSMRFDLNGIHNEDVELSIKEICIFNQLKIFQMFHCDGLFLLVTLELYSRLVVWNPYLGQTTWIKPRNRWYNRWYSTDRYAFGYNNGNHKILKCFQTENFEIYDCKSQSWRVLDVIPESVFKFNKNIQSVSLKGNTYFFDGGENIEGLSETFLLCFDFTRERFGSCISLQFHVGKFDKVALYSIREQLAVLITDYNYTCEIEIWVTTKIEPNEVSWRNFFTVATTHFKLQFFSGSFFVDQEKKLAVIFDTKFSKDQLRHKGYIMGETGFLKIVELGVANLMHSLLQVCSYTPRLVQINQGHIRFGSSLIIK